MKRIATVLMLVLLASLLTVGAFADESIDVTLTASATEVKVGDEVTVTVGIANNPGMAVLDMSLSAGSGLEFVSSQIDNGLKSVMSLAEINGVNCFAVEDENITYNGAVYSVVYKAKTAGAVTVTLAVNSLAKVDGLEEKELTYTTPVTTTVKVVCAEHTWDNGKFAKPEDAPACEKAGAKTFTCTACGATYTEPVAALEHSWDAGTILSGNEPTCESKGTRTYTCIHDPSHTRTEDVDALGHDWNDGEIKAGDEPTCEGKGTKTFTCQNDASHTKTEDVAALGHDWDEGVVKDGDQAVCGQPGTLTFTCKNDSSHTRTENTAALEHAWNDGVILAGDEPTCEDKGTKTFTCTRNCGETYTEEVAAIGHDWNEGEILTGDEPTCEDKGTKTFTCQNDAGHTKTEEVAAIGHDWNEGEILAGDEPGCETKGIKTFTCQNDASHTKTDEVAATGHKIGEAQDNGDGTHSGLCENCQEEATEACRWDDGKVTTNATATTAGVKTYTCTLCGGTKTQSLPATGNAGGQKPISDIPTTGDDSPLALMAVLFVLCGGGVAALCLLGRKKLSRY